ncbi:hypothetical protein CROQUDRAFT_131310 [Cronartium quercuum f. sp. fusiforme G11]|uniref:Uncharacterized protein n=1 Tax=Cronartium quercuum f. sp. fusiforme G11 TaxID=708437 RepID=A0A9P6NLP7_9BASI|nr:hypothetical protein CROQUDRAFT_131310 [Cronartium quercuum f. sp. fusiforme G11]
MSTLQRVSPDLEEGEISETEINGQDDNQAGHQPLPGHPHRPSALNGDSHHPHHPDEPVRTYASAKARKVMARTKRGGFKAPKPRTRPFESNRERNDDRSQNLGREVYGTTRSRRWQQERRMRSNPTVRPRAPPRPSFDEGEGAPPEEAYNYYHHPVPDEGQYETHEGYHKAQAGYAEPSFDQIPHPPPPHHPQSYEPSSSNYSYPPPQNGYEASESSSSHPCQPAYTSHIPQSAQLSPDFSMHPQHYPPPDPLPPPAQAYYPNQSVYGDQMVTMDSHSEQPVHDPYYHPEPPDHHHPGPDGSSQHAHHQIPEIAHEPYHPHPHNHQPPHQLDDHCQHTQQDHQHHQAPPQPEPEYAYQDAYAHPPAHEYQHPHPHDGSFQHQHQHPIAPEDPCRHGPVDPGQAPGQEYHAQQVGQEYAFHPAPEPQPRATEYEYEHHNGSFQPAFHHLPAPQLHHLPPAQRPPSQGQHPNGHEQAPSFHDFPPLVHHPSEPSSSHGFQDRAEAEAAEARALVSTLVGWGVTATYLLQLGISKSLLCRTFEELGFAHGLDDQRQSSIGLLLDQHTPGDSVSGSQTNMLVEEAQPLAPKLKSAAQLECLRADLELIFAGPEERQEEDDRVRMLKEDLTHICPPEALDHDGALFLANRQPLNPTQPSTPGDVSSSSPILELEVPKRARVSHNKLVMIEGMRRSTRKRKVSDAEEEGDEKRIKIRVLAIEES